MKNLDFEAFRRSDVSPIRELQPSQNSSHLSLSTSPLLKVVARHSTKANCAVSWKNSWHLSLVPTKKSAMSAVAPSRLMIRRSRFYSHQTIRRYASTTETAANAATKTKDVASSAASNATSKASQGLTRVTSAAGPLVNGAVQRVGNLVNGIGGRTGRLISFVQTCEFLGCFSVGRTQSASITRL